MTVKMQVVRLEQALGGADVDVDSLPQLVVYWPGDETEEQLAEQAGARRLWARAGVKAVGRVVVDWGEGAGREGCGDDG
jgi:hypothetical protein